MAIEFFDTSYFTSSNCKAYYRFSTGALTTDSKGSNTLTDIGDPAEDASGVFAGAVVLDSNDAYSCADNSSDWMPTGNFSVGAWIKTSTTGVNHWIAQARSIDPNIAGWWLHINTANKLDFAMGRNTGTTLHTDYETIANTTGITLTDDAWHFVVAVYNGYKIKLYVDGALDIAESWAYPVSYDTTTYVRIGQEKRSSSAALYYFTGSLDDVWITHQELTADDIYYMYSGISHLSEYHSGFEATGPIIGSEINKVLYADQYASIQDAIDALPAEGGTVFIPEGTYTITASITVPSNTTIQGAGWGTIIKIADSTNLTSCFTATTVSNITFRDLQLDGNGANQTGTAANNLLAVTYATNCVADNIYAHDAWGSGIYWGFTDGCIVKNCIANGCGKDTTGVGFGLDGTVASPAKNTKFVNCHADGNLEAGFSFYAPTAPTMNGIVASAGVMNCTLENCTSTGSTGASGVGINLLYISNCNIIGNNVSATKSGIQLYGTYNCVVSDNIITSFVAGGYGFYVVVNSAYNIISNNLILGSKACSVGIVIHSGAGEGNQIINNSISECLYQGIQVTKNNTIVNGNNVFNNSRNGILLTPASYCTIVGNHCYNNSQRNVANECGILLTGTSLYNVVSSNICNDDQHLDTSLLTGTASSGQAIVTVASTASFKAGQLVTLSDTTPQSENLEISTIDSTTQLTMTTNLTQTHTVALTGVVTGRNLQKYGIKEDTSADDYNIIIGNQCLKNVTDQILVSGTSSEYGHNIEVT